MDAAADFHRYVAEHNIPEEEWPEAFAQWIAEQTRGSEPRVREICSSPGSTFLEEREQRELDALRSALDPQDED